MTYDQYLDEHQEWEGSEPDTEEPVGTCTICGKIINVWDAYYDGVDIEDRPLVCDRDPCIRKYIKMQPMGEIMECLGMVRRED